MNYLKISFFLLMLFHSCGSIQSEKDKKAEPITKSIKDTMTVPYTKSLEGERPYYTMQITGGGCYFDIRVNDLPVWRHLEDGGISTNFPLNMYIPESGEQKIFISISPKVDKGELKVTKFASLDVEVRLYKDVDDPVLEYESVYHYKLEVPEEGKLAVLEKEVFNATVPYKVDAWQNSKILKDIDNIEEKVLAYCKNYWKVLEKKNFSQIQKLIQKREQNVAKMFYSSEEQKEERVEFGKECVLDPKIEMLPLENYVMVFYADGKVVSLEKLDGTHAIQSLIIGETEEDNDTITHYLKLHMPQGSNELEAI